MSAVVYVISCVATGINLVLLPRCCRISQNLLFRVSAGQELLRPVLQLMQLAGLLPAPGQQPHGAGPGAGAGMDALQGCAAQLQSLTGTCWAAAELEQADASKGGIPSKPAQLSAQPPSPGLQEALRAVLAQVLGGAASNATQQQVLQARQQLGGGLLEFLQCLTDLPDRPGSRSSTLSAAMHLVQGVTAQLQLLGALPLSPSAGAPAAAGLQQAQQLGLFAIAAALAQSPCHQGDVVAYCQQCLELQERLEVLLGAQAQHSDAGGFLRACQRVAGVAAAQALLEGAPCHSSQGCPAAVLQLMTAAFKGAVLLVSSEPLHGSPGSTDASDSRSSSGDADREDQEEQRTCQLVAAAAELLGWRVGAKRQFALPLGRLP